jgi:type I restriction enzyme S subunit
VIPEYIGLVFENTGISALLTVESVGSTMDNLNTAILGRVLIALPSTDEQRAIVTHIAQETAKLDALKQAAERTIGLLKERRAALIAEAVTGRIALLPTAQSSNEGDALCSSNI